MFPIKDYQYKLPSGNDLGAFGVRRKHDIHSGIDLYCLENTSVYAIEDGEVIAIEWFTGLSVGMPWWNDTQAIAIRSKSGVINYGEVRPIEGLVVGNMVNEGNVIGYVIPVLKKDKGVVPSTSMLHLELYSEYTGEWIAWELDEEKPSNLLDPSVLFI